MVARHPSKRTGWNNVWSFLEENSSHLVGVETDHNVNTEVKLAIPCCYLTLELLIFLR